MMIKKSLAHVAGRNLFYTTPFLGGKHPFFKAEHPIFMGKQTFHKRDTVFNSFANYFSWRVRKLLKKSLERS